jgi:hypothetical protein
MTLPFRGASNVNRAGLDWGYDETAKAVPLIFGGECQGRLAFILLHHQNRTIKVLY